MENKHLFIGIVASAILSSVCTAAALKISRAGENQADTEFGVIKSQMAQLKSELASERQARKELEQQIKNPLKTSGQSISLLTSNSASVATRPDQPKLPQTDVENENDISQRRRQRQSEWTARQQPEYRIEKLVSAGFAQEEATHIVQIESQELLRQLQAQYDSRRQRSESNGTNVLRSNALRTELGDQNYERYLEANGWPTSAHIGGVIGGSPGELAGLRFGDKITSYAGERVFNLNDINNLTIQGTRGESVLIELEREGESVQLTIPRGPIGINGR